MLAYGRRARWIRRMQDRAARRHEREWARQGLAPPVSWTAPGRDQGSSTRRLTLPRSPNSMRRRCTTS